MKHIIFWLILLSAAGFGAGAAELAGVSDNSRKGALAIVKTASGTVMGVLESEDAANVVVIAGAQVHSFPRREIKEFIVKNRHPGVSSREVSSVAAPKRPVEPASSPRASAVPTTKGAQNGEAVIPPAGRDLTLAELNSPAGQALLHEVHDAFIGGRSAAASEYYYSTMAKLGSGEMGVDELQSEAARILEQLKLFEPEMRADPNAQEWLSYERILRDFAKEPGSAPTAKAGPLR